MITENLSTLKINKLTQAQYDRALEAGNIDVNALYLTPDENCVKTVNSVLPDGNGNVVVKATATQIPYVSTLGVFNFDPTIIGNNQKYWCSASNNDVENIIDVASDYAWTEGMVYEAFIIHSANNGIVTIKIPSEWEGVDSLTADITLQSEGNFVYIRWVKIGTKVRWWIEKQPSVNG